FAMPAIFLGIAQAEDSRFCRFLVQLARQFALDLPAVDMRRDLARDEAADALRQCFMGFVVKGRARAPVVKSCHAAMLRRVYVNVKSVARRPCTICSSI